MANTLKFVATMDDRVSQPLGTMHQKFNALSQNKGFLAVATGVGVGAGIAALGGLAAGINAVSGFLQDSTVAYNEDQKSIAQLDAALKANIKSWDGTTGAIEAVLTARMKLGFSDEEQRVSLGRLVAATHDSTEALKVQRVAMDLARFKGISLADATDALTKVEAGSYRILKSLGIELAKGATQTEALAAVQKVAAGQAEAYAQTNEGKLLVSSIKVNEAQEKLGKTMANLQAQVLPALADGLTTLVDNLDRATIAFHFLTGQIPSAMAELEQYNLAHKDEALAAIVAANAENESTAAIIQDSIDKAKAAQSSTATIVAADTRVVKSYDEMTRSLKSDASSLIDDVFDPAIEKMNLVADAAEAADLRKKLSSGKLTKAETRDAQIRLLELTKSANQTQLNLFNAGELTKKQTDDWLTALRKKAASETGLAKVKIDELIGAILDLRRASAGAINVNVNMGKGSGARASGGLVPPGWSGTVGEEGTERLVMFPGGGGYVVPHSGTPATKGSGVTINIAGLVRAETPEDIGRMLRRYASLGLTA